MDDTRLSDALATAQDSHEERPFVPEQIESIMGSASRYIRDHFSRYWPSFVPLFIWILWLAYLLLERSVFSLVALTFIWLPILIALVPFVMAMGEVKKEFMQQFAAANGYTYAPSSTCDDLHGFIFSYGNDRKVSDVVTGQFNGFPFSLFTYSFGFDNNEGHELFIFCVMKIQCNIALPEVILESRNHPYMPPLTPLHHNATNETVQLEGDFNQYFRLFAKKGNEVNVLEALTPDVMEDLIDYAKRFGMEMAGRDIFIYDGVPIRKKEDIYALYGFAKLLVEKVIPFWHMSDGDTAS